MPQKRPSAWAIIGALVICLSVSTAAVTTAAENPALQIPLVASPTEVCTPGNLPTRWPDELHPPNTIRVLRSRGPNAGRVETVDFWKYVGTVLRAEYSSGKDKPDPWMRLGALTVKQYAWYKTMFWGGGRITFLNPDGVTSTTQCWDVKDTTADQIYKELKPDPANPGAWIPANVPTAINLKAMRETWHISLRKWVVKKNKSRLFLSGYRSGLRKPCGTDSTGFKIFQKSLRDCGVKTMRFEETLRRYYEPRLEIVDTRGHDVLSDGSAWRGDLGIINGSGSWRLYKGAASGFDGGANGSFAGLGELLGQGVGETTGASEDANPQNVTWNDPRLFADLVMLVNDGGKKLKVARGKGSGFAAPTSRDAPSDSEQLVVGDFNGDRIADAGLLSTPSAGNGKLVVMRGQGNDTFAAPVDWWTGPLSLGGNTFVAAGDVNGDGKSDLIMRDSDAGAYRVALSVASCSTFANWGACTTPGGTGLGAATTWLDSSTTLAATRNAVTDFDRDGRDDVVVVMANNGSGIKVMALRARPEGGFADPAQLWTGAGSVADTLPFGMNVDPDGLGDLALVTKSGTGTNVTWLRSIAKTSVPATMTSTSTRAGSFDWAGARPF